MHKYTAKVNKYAMIYCKCLGRFAELSSGPEFSKNSPIFTGYRANQSAQLARVPGVKSPTGEDGTVAVIEDDAQSRRGTPPAHAGCPRRVRHDPDMTETGTGDPRLPSLLLGQTRYSVRVAGLSDCVSGTTGTIPGRIGTIEWPVNDQPVTWRPPLA